MKVIVCTGSPNSGFEGVFELLMRAGVVGAKPAEQDALSPQDIETNLLNAQEIKNIGNEPLKQVLPGKIWEKLAADLFLRNINSQVWGWTSENAALLMDFWQDFDPQVKILMVYHSPIDYLAQVLYQTEQNHLAVIPQALNQWVNWNTELLRHFHRNTDRCLLVNSAQVAAQPAAFLDKLRSFWGIECLRDVKGDATPQYIELQRHVVRQLLDGRHPANALCEELDMASIDLPSQFNESTDGVSQTVVWSDWMAMRSKLNAIDKAKIENGVVRKMPQTQSQNERSFKDNIAGSHISSRTRQRENELLLHIHDLGIELERIFSNNIVLKEEKLSAERSVFAARFWLTHQPSELIIDMRKEIVLTNWYAPESDGRWAGPELVSTIKIPPLEVGNYIFTLHIVDAMDPEIVRQMKIEAFGVSVPHEVQLDTGNLLFPTICTTKIYISPVVPAEPWDFTLRFNDVISPAEFGSEDNRFLAIRVRSLTISRVP